MTETIIAYENGFGENIIENEGREVRQSESRPHCKIAS